MTPPHKVVLDCNVYFQAVISATGPANRLLSLIFDGGASFFISTVLMEELSNLLADVRVIKKYRLDPKEDRRFPDSDQDARNPG